MISFCIQRGIIEKHCQEQRVPVQFVKCMKLKQQIPIQVASFSINCCEFLIKIEAIEGIGQMALCGRQ